MTAVALAPIVLVAVVAVTALWVYRDASAHEERGAPVRFSAGGIDIGTPTVWSVGCLVLWVIFLPLYVTCRRAAG